DRRSHARDRSVEGAEPERYLPAAVGPRDRSGEHAQQGEPPRGDFHAPRRGPRPSCSHRRVARGCPRRSRLMDQGAEIPIDLGRIRWIGFKTILIREYGRIIRIWGQTLVPPAVTAMLYFVIFGSLIGRRVGEMGGFSYMLYLAPGLIMMSVITSSY